MLATAFCAALANGGPTYAFGLYDAALKATLYYLMQSRLDVLSGANFCAGLLSWLPGLVADRLSIRTAVMGTTGGVVMSLALTLTGYWFVASRSMS